MGFFLEQLYQIQQLREAIGPLGIALMNWVSQNLLSLLGIIPLYIFWCRDKKAGYTMAFAVSVGSLANHLLKLTCCVERPWVLDERITPPEVALQNQGGYSFPSGHAQLAAGYLAGSAIWLRRKKALSAACWLALALIGFSRVYLGVHTLLDVLAGIGEAVILLLVFRKLIPWFWNDRKRTTQVCAAILAAALLSTVYFLVKPYPLHYDAAGQLLTDPKTMITFSGVGAASGFALGMFLERRFVDFTTDVPARAKLYRLLIGVLIYLPLYAAGNHLMPQILGGYWGGYFFNLALWTFTLAGYPYFFNKLRILGAAYDKSGIA